MLDFDGTLTDSHKEADGFSARYLSGLAKAVGMSEGELSAVWESTHEMILSAPERFGWEPRGRIIAPAASDPFILAGVVAARSLDALGLLKDRSERNRVLDSIFHSNYALNKTIFREGAADFLRKLMELSGACIVSGSPKADVERKLSALRLPAGPQVFGSAQKDELDDSWEAVPESVDAGLGRPVFLRRRKYWDILESVLMARGLEPSEALVAGNIYELDLSLPRFMGMRIALLKTESTSAPEMEAASEGGRGFVSGGLYDCLGKIVSLL